MTLGVFAPLAAAVNMLVIIALMLRKRSRLPGRMEQGYGEHIERQKRATTITILAAILAPILLYVMLNIVTDEGQLRLF